MLCCSHRLAAVIAFRMDCHFRYRAILLLLTFTPTSEQAGELQENWGTERSLLEEI